MRQGDQGDPSAEQNAVNRNAFKSCAVIWRIMRPYLKIERKATARSGKTFEKWKIILNLKEILTDPEMTKGRVMTHLEMCDYTLELALRKMQEKYGSGMQ